MKHTSPTIATALLLAHATQIYATQEQRPPNFIIINCDDLGYADIGAYGHPTIATPNLDRMANEGQKWTSFYVSASVSSPSRAGLLTGRLGIRNGMYGDRRGVLFPDSPEGLPLSEITIAEMLKAQGYATAHFGKWHLGKDNGYMPWNNGFDTYYGIPYSNDMSKTEQTIVGNKNYPYPLPFYDGKEVIEHDPDQTLLTKRLTERTVKYIKEQSTQKPFLIYLAHPMPHIPIYASENFVGKSRRGAYGDTIEELDWSVGEILKALKEENMQENTLVIFTSDNGPWLSYKQEGGSAGHLKDGKASTYEGGFRVPCIMWGAMLKPGVNMSMGSTLDFFPTLCHMAGADLPTDREYDGQNIANSLTKGEDTEREYFYFYRGSELFALRKGAYKIHFVTQTAYGKYDRTVLTNPLLYNVEHDPEERYNIASDHPEIVEQLTKHKNKHVEQTRVERSVFDLPNEPKP